MLLQLYPSENSTSELQCGWVEAGAFEYPDFKSALIGPYSSRGPAVIWYLYLLIGHLGPHV